MSTPNREQLENLKRYIESLSPDAYQRQIAKSKEPEAVFRLVRLGDTTGIACALQNGLSAEIVDRNGMTLLHHAAGHDARLVCELLLEQPNATAWKRDRYGRLPLDIARECGHDAMGDQLERVTYPSLFRDEQDGPVRAELIERFDTKHRELGSPDTRPDFARSIEFRKPISLAKDHDRGNRER